MTHDKSWPGIARAVALVASLGAPACGSSSEGATDNASGGSAAPDTATGGGTQSSTGGGAPLTGGASGTGGTKTSGAGMPGSSGSTTTGGSSGTAASGAAGEENTAGSGGADSVASDPCEPNPCAHGTCTATGTTYECTCEEGYEGALCETNIDDCSPNPCENGGACEDGVTSHECTCAEGFGGKDCAFAAFELLPEIEGAKASRPSLLSADEQTVVGTVEMEDLKWRVFRVRGKKLEDLSSLPDAAACSPVGMTRDGSVIVGNCTAVMAGEHFGFIVEGGVMKRLPAPSPYVDALVSSISADGRIVTARGKLFSAGSGVVNLTWIDGVATESEIPETSYAVDVNDDGSVLLTDEAFNLALFRDGVTTPLPPLPGTQACRASELSVDGRVVIGTCEVEPDFKRLVRWTDFEPEALSTPVDLAEANFNVLSVPWNGNAVLAGAYFMTGVHVIWDTKRGMRRLAEAMQGIGLDEATIQTVVPTGISDDGRTLIGTISVEKRQRPFIARLR